MSEKAKAAQQARWANTGEAERARLGKKHSAALRIWWAGLSDEEKSRRGRNAALKKHAKNKDIDA